MNARDPGQKFSLSGFQVSGDVTAQGFHPRLKTETGQGNLKRLKLLSSNNSSNTFGVGGWVGVGVQDF